MQVDLELRVAPARVLTHVTTREPDVASIKTLLLGALRDHCVDLVQQAPRLRRQLVERAAEHLVREPVRDPDVVERHLDVLEALAVVLGSLERALILVQQRDRADQRQVLQVIAAQPRLLVAERQLLGVRVSD